MSLVSAATGKTQGHFLPGAPGDAGAAHPDGLWGEQISVQPSLLCDSAKQAPVPAAPSRELPGCLSGPTITVHDQDSLSCAGFRRGRHGTTRPGVVTRDSNGHCGEKPGGKKGRGGERGRGREGSRAWRTGRGEGRRERRGVEGRRGADLPRTVRLSQSGAGHPGGGPQRVAEQGAGGPPCLQWMKGVQAESQGVPFYL